MTWESVKAPLPVQDMSTRLSLIYQGYMQGINQRANRRRERF